VEQGFIQTTPDNSIVLIAGVVGAATLLVGGLVLAVLAYRRSEAEEEHAEEDAFVNA
jgi:NhaP-type Na+/H+ or K+/H+ antiporter